MSPSIAVRILLLIAVTFCSGFQAQAQILPNELCPPPGRWVSRGGGSTMCQCPDGSFYGIGMPCRSQQRSQPQQQQQQQFRTTNIARVNEQRALAPVLNKTTGKIEKRRGQSLVAPNGRSVWYHPPIYAGPAYLRVQNVGWVEMDQRYESIIYPALASGVSAQIEEALALIEGSAIMQGLMEMPESDGD